MLKHCKIRTIDSQKCDYRIRKSKKWQNKVIILTGKYAFDYSIHIVDKADKTVFTIKFDCRDKAIKEYNKYK